MARHSKNNTAGTHFTYHEKRKAGHGSKRQRFGKDSQIRFGYCCLSIKAAKDPVVTPSGYIYSREFIYENLLAQKQELKRQKAKFEEARRKEEEEELEQKEREKLEKLEDFARNNISVRDNGAMKRKRDDKEDVKDLQKQLTAKQDLQTKEDKRKELKRTSFWIPDFTPEAKVTVEKPREHPVDPMSGTELKLKHLMPAKIIWESDSSGDSFVLCAVTKKVISHQKAVLLRPSGQIILESCLKDLVLPSMTCPVTGVKLRKKDIIPLIPGGSSYCATSNVEAHKYQESMT